MGETDDRGEWGGVGTNGHVDNVRLIVSRWITVGVDDEEDEEANDDEVDDDDDAHTQWPNDVIVFIRVKRRARCEFDEMEKSLRRSESDNKRSVES